MIREWKARRSFMRNAIAQGMSRNNAAALWEIGKHIYAGMGYSPTLQPVR